MSYELKSRECPECHKFVSYKICSEYIVYGTSHVVRCNHCNTALSLKREPLPFKWCVFAGFASTVIPANLCLYVLKLDIVRSLAYASFFGILSVIVCSILTLKKIYFKVAF